MHKLLTMLALALTVPALAATKTYQVTGPVLRVDAASITVQKGNEKWEIARDGSVNVPAGVKVGDKITVEYRMSAVSVDAKTAKAAKPAKKK